MAVDMIKVWGKILLHNKLMDPAHWDFFSSEYVDRGRDEDIGELLVKSGYLQEEHLAQINVLVEKVAAKQQAEADEQIPDQIDLAEDGDSYGNIDMIKQHPDVIRPSDWAPGDADQIDIEEDAIEFDGEIGKVKDHFTAVQDTSYVDESEMLEMEEERDENNKVAIEAPDAWLQRRSEAEHAGFAEADVGEGDLELADEVPEEGDIAAKPSELDWVDSTEHVPERESYVDESERIDLDGDDDL